MTVCELYARHRTDHDVVRVGMNVKCNRDGPVVQYIKSVGQLSAIRHFATRDRYAADVALTAFSCAAAT